MSYFLVTTEDFETFVELFDGKITREPGRSNSDVRANFKLANDVEMELNLRAINVTPHGQFYGTNDGYTHIRFDRWAWDNTSFRGKGSRSDETHALAKEILTTIGQFSNWTNGLEPETVVTLVDSWEE